MVVDFYDVGGAVQPVIDGLDGTCLNEALLNPTAEAIVVLLWRRIVPGLPQLSELRLWETDDCQVVYCGEPVSAELIAEGNAVSHPSTAPADESAPAV
jgi:6-pyruvoyltetrahydropterin/6-carboxytetrahydropterin synthase